MNFIEFFIINLFICIVLAICDFSSSVVVLVGGLCKGVFNAYWDEYGSYDALIDLPLGNFFNSLGVMAMISVTWGKTTPFIFLNPWEKQIIFFLFQIVSFSYRILNVSNVCVCAVVTSLEG